MENLEYSERRSLSKNLDLCFLSVDEQGNIIPKTPDAVLVATQTYMYTTRPSPGDPREHMHRAALQGLRMVGNKLTAKEEEAHRNKENHKPRSPRHHNSPRHRSGSRRSRSPSPRRHKSPKHEEPKGPGLPPKRMTMKTMKKRWGRRALLIEFAPHQYPRVSNYPMTSKSMMDLRSHSHGSQITYRQ
jgi:hypothetical protein